MPGFAYERVQAGKPMPGIFVVHEQAPIGRVIEDILILADCSHEGEWDSHVRYLPL